MKITGLLSLLLMLGSAVQAASTSGANPVVPEDKVGFYALSVPYKSVMSDDTSCKAIGGVYDSDSMTCSANQSNTLEIKNEGEYAVVEITNTGNRGAHFKGIVTDVEDSHLLAVEESSQCMVKVIFVGDTVSAEPGEICDSGLNLVTAKKLRGN